MLAVDAAIEDTPYLNMSTMVPSAISTATVPKLFVVRNPLKVDVVPATIARFPLITHRVCSISIKSRDPDFRRLCGKASVVVAEAVVIAAALVNFIHCGLTSPDPPVSDDLGRLLIVLF